MPPFNLSKRPNVKIGIEMWEYCEAARALKVPLASIRAVDEIESAGSGFIISNGRPKILFEGHYLYSILKKEHGQVVASKAQKLNPTICYPKWTKKYYIGRAGEYARLAKATEICHTLGVSDRIALRSASWGRYQIMGENWHSAGFKSVDDFVEAHFQDEALHLKAFLAFVKKKGLVPALQQMPDAPGTYATRFAAVYNGPRYAENRYHTKIANAVIKFSRQDVDCASILDAQEHVVEAMPGERVSDPPEVGFENTRLDTRYESPEESSSGDGALVPEDDPTDGQEGSSSLTHVQVGPGGVVVDTATDEGEPEKIAIEKPAPVGFWRGLWQRIVAATGTNVGFEVVADNAQKVGALGLSPETWAWIGWLILAATIFALIGYVYSRRQDKKREEMITQLLIEANTTANNQIQLVDSDLLELYRAQGYKVITR